MFILILLLLSFKSYADDSGLQIYAAADLVYSQGINKDSLADERLVMRGAEFSLFAPIDHHFDGNLTAVAHDEAGALNFELHELTLATSKLVDRLRIKGGMFFLGVGRLNRFHQHDWAFTTAPKVHRTFFDKEGVLDMGVESTYLLPTSFFLEATLGVTSGHNFGHAHTKGVKPKVPTHYSRVGTFISHGNADGTEFGFNYVGRRDNTGERMQLIGLDHITKFKEGKSTSWLLQSEWWYRKKNKKGLDTREEIGAYVFTDFALNDEVSMGIGIDLFKDLSHKNGFGKKLNNIYYGTIAQLTYRSSEFLSLRPTFSYNMRREEGTTHDRDMRVELQAVFILGAHPAHEF